MAQRQNHLTALRTAFALLALVMMAPGCSRQNDSVAQVGTAEDYVQRQNNPYSYGSYHLCTAFDPFCVAPRWYPAPVYYYWSDDGDNDCDDGNCRGSSGAGHHKPGAVSRAGRNPSAITTSSAASAPAPHRFDAGVPSTGSAHFGGSFGRGAFGGGRRGR